MGRQLRKIYEVHWAAVSSPNAIWCVAMGAVAAAAATAERDGPLFSFANHMLPPEDGYDAQAPLLSPRDISGLL